MKENPKLELTNQEKKAVFMIYLDSDMYQEARDIYPKGDELLIADVRSKGNMEVLKDLKNVTSKAILYEQYILDENYEQAANLVVDIDRDVPERQESIAKTYTYSDQLDIAAKYANKIEDEKIKETVIAWYTDYVNKQELTDEAKKTKIADGITLINREMDI